MEGVEEEGDGWRMGDGCREVIVEDREIAEGTTRPRRVPLSRERAPRLSAAAR